MSLQDPVADMLVRIKNAQAVGKLNVVMPASKLKCAIAEVLKLEGYITDYQLEGDEQTAKKLLTVSLKYYHGAPVIDSIERISRPGLRVYKRKNELPQVLNGLGIAIISTSKGKGKGIMSDRQARKEGFGGEVLCYVS